MIQTLTSALLAQREHVKALTPALERFRFMSWFDKNADSGPVVCRLSVSVGRSADAAVVPFSVTEEIVFEASTEDRQTLLEDYIAAVRAFPLWVWGADVIIHNQEPVDEAPNSSALRVNLAATIRWEGYASWR